MSVEKNALNAAPKSLVALTKNFAVINVESPTRTALTATTPNLIRNINNTLRKNRRILLDLNTTGKSKQRAKNY